MTKPFSGSETAKSLPLCKIVCQYCLPQVFTILSIPSNSRGPSTTLRILNFATPSVGKIGKNRLSPRVISGLDKLLSYFE